MKIEMVPISKIKPYWRNPRHNEAGIEVVKESIERYGFNQPIVVDKKNVIVVGHTRYKALLQLGWENVPVIVADLSPAKAKEYRIADNKTAEFSTWKMDALVPEVRQIEDIEGMQIFFPDVDLEKMMEEVSAGVAASIEEIRKKEEELEGRYGTTAGNEIKSYVEVICPHCAGEFYVDRNEINRQPAVEKPE